MPTFQDLQSALDAVEQAVNALKNRVAAAAPPDPSTSLVLDQGEMDRLIGGMNTLVGEINGILPAPPTS